MVVKGYFDGGNQANINEYDRITLATACGTEAQWHAFHLEWSAAKLRHHAPFLHTTNAVSLQKEFSCKNGWDEESVNSYVLDCVGVIGDHLSVLEKTDETALNPRVIKEGLRVVTMTILLDDYRRARKKNPRLPNSVTEICLSECLGFCFRWGSRLRASGYQFYFDQGEPFYGHLHDRRVSKQCKEDVPFMEKIVHAGESDMRLVPALQMADLFAWCINHNDSVSLGWHGLLHSFSWQSLYLDYKLLLGATPGALERTAAWALPRRKLNPPPA